MTGYSGDLVDVRRTWLWWSSGKDSAWSLERLRTDPTVEVAGLVTTVTEAYDRVAMHAVRSELLRAQAAAVGLALHTVLIPARCSNVRYEAAVRDAVSAARDAGVEAMAFGDLFLDDIRAYRERLFDELAMQTLFPIWGADTAALAREMIARGLRARVTCIDPKALPETFAGRSFDAGLLADLPPTVDPCGENGEFHTFAHAGPMFSREVPVCTGERVTRDGFVFCDLLPAQPRGEGSGGMG